MQKQMIYYALQHIMRSKAVWLESSYVNDTLKNCFWDYQDVDDNPKNRNSTEVYGNKSLVCSFSHRCLIYFLRSNICWVRVSRGCVFRLVGYLPAWKWSFATSYIMTYVLNGNLINWRRASSRWDGVLREAKADRAVAPWNIGQWRKAETTPFRRAFAHWRGGFSCSVGATAVVLK